MVQSRAKSSSIRASLISLNDVMGAGGAAGGRARHMTHLGADMFYNSNTDLMNEDGDQSEEAGKLSPEANDLCG